jgi:ketol-acid reductoisomerase
VAKVYYDKDANLGFLKNKTIGVIGYGNQGRAQSLNLRDSGAKVIIGVRADKTRRQAIEDGFEVTSIREAAKQAQIILLLIPDEVMSEVFESKILLGLAPGKAICFASGYNVAFKLIKPPKGVDVIMVAPRMIGAGVRQRYLEGKGFSSFIGVKQDATGKALKIALALSKGIGSTRCGVMLLTFAQEAELDLFSEQAFGPAFGHVMLSAMQTLIDAGYPVEAVMEELMLSGEFAYEMQKIVEMGFIDQTGLHSHTAMYGAMTRFPRFMTQEVPQIMREVLADICSGAFAKEWNAEQKAGLPVYKQLSELKKKYTVVEWDRKTRRAFHSS